MTMTQLDFLDLEDAPELAALEVLRHSILVAEQALLAQYQELTSGEKLSFEQGDLPQLWLADTIISQGRLLRISLERYLELCSKPTEIIRAPDDPF